MFLIAVAIVCVLYAHNRPFIARVPERRRYALREASVTRGVYTETFPATRRYLAIVVVFPFLRDFVGDCNHSRLQGRRSISQRQPGQG
jgi:hypothetical protein